MVLESVLSERNILRVEKKSKKSDQILRLGLERKNAVKTVRMNRHSDP